MRNLFKSFTIPLAVMIALSSHIGAQEPASHGFLNLVNLVPGDKPCMIGVTGKDVVPGGLASAQSTGWFIVPAGNLQLTLEVKGYDKGTGAVDLSAMQSSLFVIFLESSGKTNAEGKPLPPKIKLKRCEAIDGKSGFFLKLVSLCPGENTFLLGLNPMTLKLFQEAEVPNWNGGGFKISKDQAVIGQVLPELEKDPFYLFVGTDHAGKYCTTLVRASKQDLPPWMKEKKPTP
jgi:hypothetical protein